MYVYIYIYIYWERYAYMCYIYIYIYIYVHIIYTCVWYNVIRSSQEFPGQDIRVWCHLSGTRPILPAHCLPIVTILPKALVRSGCAKSLPDSASIRRSEAAWRPWWVFYDCLGSRLLVQHSFDVPFRNMCLISWMSLRFDVHEFGELR